MDKQLLKISKFDASDYLKDNIDVQNYLDEVNSENNPAAFLQAISTLARVNGITKLAKDTGIPAENLYQSLSGKDSSEFYTLWKIAEALGYELVMRKKTAA